MIRVAIQGIEGSYSSDAARRLVGSESVLIECRDFDLTFAALRRGDADCLVVPVENKIVGEINGAASLLRESGLRTHAELELKIRHVLVGTQDSEISRLTSVRSHVEALRQCSRFLNSHPQLERVIDADTASGVRWVVENGDARCSAIASQQAAEIFGGKILREDIADDRDNWTKFYLVGN